MAQTKYGIEELLDDVATLLTTYLNTKITEINTEKSNDAYSIEAIDSGAYFLQTMDEKAANYKNFVLYGVSDIETVANGPSTSQNITVEVTIVMHDPRENVNVAKRCYRYSRALREVIQDNWHLATNAVKIEVESLVPAEFELWDNSSAYRAIGIQIKANIA